MSTFLYRGHEIFYSNEGTGEPLVFIHGMGGNSINWLNQRMNFKRYYQVIAIDLPGHGKSEAAADLSYSDYHQVLYQLLKEHLQLEDVVICGISMGGRVALDFVHYYPEMVKAVVLADTFAGMEESDTARRKEIFDLIYEEDGGKKWVARVVEEMGFDPNSSIAKGFHKGILQNQLDFIYRLFIQTLGYDQRPFLASIRKPTLIIHGERDRFIPFSAAEELHHAIQGSRLVTIPDSGHLPNVEQSKVFNQELQYFLDLI